MIRDVRSAEVVLPCAELDPTLRFFCDELGFVLRSIMPADHPRQATIEAHGLRLCLQADTPGAPGVIRLHRGGDHGDDNLPTAGSVLTAPNGTRIEVVAARTAIDLPPLRAELIVTQPIDADGWQTGRAGMRYRDLIPGRQGGRFIASHILIPDGGPVADYPHHHGVRFQMIYCHRGHVQVVYEDQGPPFEMQAGDAVLQPPGILHRVLACSPGLEVVEIGCPAEHMTFAEPERTLPNPELRPERVFADQRFVRHQAATATWLAGRHAGSLRRDTGIAAATSGLAGAWIVRVDGASCLTMPPHGGELLFAFVTAGQATLEIDERQPETLREGSAITVPGHLAFALADCSPDFAFLEVTLPAVAS